MTGTKADYEAQVNAAVDKYWQAFGLGGEWRKKVAFRSADEKGAQDMLDTAAWVGYDPEHRIANFSFSPRLRPDYYELEAAHECLHVLFFRLERAIDQLTEPARSLMDDALHAIVDRLARVLTGMAPIDRAEVNDLGAPWEVIIAAPPPGNVGDAGE